VDEMISRPNGSRSNQLYVTLAKDHFEYNSKALREKSFTESHAKTLGYFLKEVRDKTPFELPHKSDEPWQSVSCAQAFGTRIPVWKVIDKAIGDEFYVEGNDTREGRIDSFNKLLPDVVRFIRIRTLLIETDVKLAKLDFPSYFYDAMSSSELLCENAGKFSYEKVERVIEKAVVGLRDLYFSTKESPPCATEEELAEFFRENPGLRHLCS
jgi:hypothetical protein